MIQLPKFDRLNLSNFGTITLVPLAVPGGDGRPDGGQQDQEGRQEGRLFDAGDQIAALGLQPDPVPAGEASP